MKKLGVKDVMVFAFSKRYLKLIKNHLKTGMKFPYNKSYLPNHILQLYIPTKV